MVAVGLVLALLAAACAGARVEATDAAEYVAAMQRVEDAFNDADVGSPESGSYPLEEGLVFADALYGQFESRLSGWRAVEAPGFLRDDHQRLISAVDTLQDVVGEYLLHAALEGEFQFDRLPTQPEISSAQSEARAACRAMLASLRDAGATPSIRFAGGPGCNF